MIADRQEEKEMTTKEKIVEAASKAHGEFVNTDGAWCMANTPEQFKAFLEKTFGFEVLDCKATTYSTAIATTACGLSIAWNGHCSRVTD